MSVCLAVGGGGAEHTRLGFFCSHSRHRLSSSRSLSGRSRKIVGQGCVSFMAWAAASEYWHGWSVYSPRDGTWTGRVYSQASKLKLVYMPAPHYRISAGLFLVLHV